MFIGLGAVLYFVLFQWASASYQKTARAEFLDAVAMATADSQAATGKNLSRATATVVNRNRPVARKDASGDARAFAQLRIPDVHLDVMVREGVDEDTLRLAVGHLGSSAMPGQRGNVVLLGHRDTFFRPLRELKTGEIAEVRTVSGLFRYRIEEIKVLGPDDVDVAQPVDLAAMTLVTCFPFHYIGPSPRRYVARGRLIESY